jgi:hypothetical protein
MIEARTIKAAAAAQKHFCPATPRTRFFCLFAKEELCFALDALCSLRRDSP